MNKKHYDILLRTMAITLELLLYNIIYIILYSSALLIFINDCMFGIVVYFIASHTILNIIIINLALTRSNPKPIKKITVLRLFYKLSLTVVAVIILMLKAHWYLATVTIVIVALSVKFYWDCTRYKSRRLEQREWHLYLKR